MSVRSLRSRFAFGIDVLLDEQKEEERQALLSIANNGLYPKRAMMLIENIWSATSPQGILPTNPQEMPMVESQGVRFMARRPRPM